jgi:DNA-binding IclR family transcriptional regulator
MKGSQLAREIGISLTQAYALASALRKDGSIRKSGKGYRVKPKAGK